MPETVSERACTMSAPMISSYFAGIKGETRRILDMRKVATVVRDGKVEIPEWQMEELLKNCRYGKPGDELWFRENWRTIAELDHCKPAQVNKGRPIIFEAGTQWTTDDANRVMGKLRTSRFMCKWMARARHIPILDIRAERLQDITEEGAKNEGCSQKFWIDSALSAGCLNARGHRGTYKEGYKDLWESINGPGSWALNPWCWVVKFPLYKKP